MELDDRIAVVGSQTYVALEGTLQNQLLSHCRDVLQVCFDTRT